LILATFWVPASSHALLQSLSLIHERHADHDEHYHHNSEAPHEHDHNHDGIIHDLADGICRTEARGFDVPVVTSQLIDATLCAAVISCLTDTLTVGLDRAGPSPPGTSPPELFQIWRFSLRAALPIRAPSLAS
jgi:hypothetical protein